MKTGKKKKYTQEELREAFLDYRAAKEMLEMAKEGLDTIVAAMQTDLFKDAKTHTIKQIGHIELKVRVLACFDKELSLEQVVLASKNLFLSPFVQEKISKSNLQAVFKNGELCKVLAGTDNEELLKALNEIGISKIEEKKAFSYKPV